MLQASQMSRFHPFWHTELPNLTKLLNCRINGCLKAISLVQKYTKWILYDLHIPSIECGKGIIKLPME